MKSIVYIADPEILAIPVVECHELLVDIKMFNDLCYGLPPECALTANHYTKMRSTVYNKLLIAQDSLPSGLKFKLYEGYRSLEVQQLLFD